MDDTSRLLQIRESDLAEIEQAMPLLLDEIQFKIEGLSPVGRKRCRRIQQILSDVRWNYGPYTEIEKVE